MTTAGFLGLGRMGAPMAANLIGQVDRLLVHDLMPAAVASLVGKGAEAAGSATALGERCEIVFMSLPTPPIVRAAAAEIVSGGAPRILCDLSTSGPQLAQELHDMLAPKGVASFDAPVSGGIRGAEQGTLAIMAGGPEALWPELEHLQRIRHRERVRLAGCWRCGDDRAVGLPAVHRYQAQAAGDRDADHLRGNRHRPLGGDVVG